MGREFSGPRRISSARCIEIRDPRRGDENHSSGVPIARYCYIEIKDPRGGDENQMGLIFLASS